MLKTRCLILFSALWLFAQSAAGQDTIDSAAGTETIDRRSRAARQRVRDVTDKLFSPSVSETFYVIAYELAGSPDAARAEADQALMMLNAAASLDSRANYVLADMIKIASSPSHEDQSQIVYNLLIEYVDKLSDLEVSDKAVRYLLEQLSSREEREMLLGVLLTDVGPANTALSSELATLLGLLKAEKTDDPNATQLLAYAYSSDKYNQLAYEKLAELLPRPPGPVNHLEYLRLKLRENPLDMKTALAFAEYADRIQLYETASGSYQYCAELFRFLHPGEDLPALVYLPWSVSSYNSRRNQPRCLQIAEQLRSEGRFDLLAEAIAGKAAVKIGRTEQADRILRAAEERAIRSVLAGDGIVDNKQLAWFYCFVVSEPENAIDWANKAYSADPNSPTAASMLAYSLAKNGQAELAEALINNYQPNQIAILTLGLVRLTKADKTAAIETLKTAIDLDGGSLAAEEAKRILAHNDAEYIPLIDPGFVLKSLRETVGEKIVPNFAEPRDIISLQLSLRGNKFSYGTSFGASVAITNNWFEPLVISDDALFKGFVAVDAEVTGDLNEQIPNLASVRIRPSFPVEPGHSAVAPIRLQTGRLRELLLSHPQAALNIEFTVYLDPVWTGDGRKINGVPGTEPVTVTIKRPAVEISREFLQNRLNSLSRGRQGQKIKTAQLFAGLLLEQRAMAGGEPPYKFKFAGWMPDLLKSSLIHSLINDDWLVRVHTMNAILPLALDYELTDAVSTSLNSPDWPARMMALYVLASQQGDSFQKVLDHSAQHDLSEYVRNMALALGAAPPLVRTAPEQEASQVTEEEPDN